MPQMDLIITYIHYIIKGAYRMAEKDYKKKIEFDADGERFYETGVKNVVLYLKKNLTTDENPKPYNNGVAWNGVTSISENPSGAEI